MFYIQQGVRGINFLQLKESLAAKGLEKRYSKEHFNWKLDLKTSSLGLVIQLHNCFKYNFHFAMARINTFSIFNLLTPSLLNSD